MEIIRMIILKYCPSCCSNVSPHSCSSLENLASLACRSLESGASLSWRIASLTCRSLETAASLSRRSLETSASLSRRSLESTASLSWTHGQSSQYWRSSWSCSSRFLRFRSCWSSCHCWCWMSRSRSCRPWKNSLSDCTIPSSPHMSAKRR